MPNNHKNILVLFNGKHPFDRKIYEGIMDAIACSNEKSDIFAMDYDEIAQIGTQHQFDAIIANFEDERISQYCSRQALPVVGIAFSEPDSATLRKNANILIAVDSRKIAEIAFNHFVACGAEKFFYFSGITSEIGPWRDERLKYFKAIIGDSQKKWLGHYTTESIKEFLLSSFQKGSACLCASDTYARQLIVLCKSYGVHVPQDLLIIGIDDDEMENRLSPIPLTTIPINAVDIGKLAYTALSDIFRYSNPEHGKKLLHWSPNKIVNRQSAPSFDSGDFLVAQALSYLHANSHRPIKSYQLADACNCSKFILEQKFQNSLNKSIHQAIYDVKIEKAKNLLIKSHKNLTEIAILCGYSNVQYLYYIFKKEFGMTPHRYRDTYKDNLSQ